jgi:hypothetical protein
LDEQGRLPFLSALSRAERRRIKAEGAKIGKRYRDILLDLRHSGVGYPVDQILRDFAIEYTHRYASSGVSTQPLSFNYIEPFCTVRLIENTVAPFIEPCRELDHLFSVGDYFDYITAQDSPSFELSELLTLREGLVHHFTQNGTITDFTYMTAEGREFVISGFSMVRRGRSLHWYILGGEVLTDTEWRDRCENNAEIRLDDTPPWKRPFLAQSIAQSGDHFGPPVALQGTSNAIRTIIAGETDLRTARHVARCYMSETENSFAMFCDDPEPFSYIEDPARRADVLREMQKRVEDASVMWNLAEGFFRLVNYFQCRFTVAPAAVKLSEKSQPRTAKGGRGVGAHFKHVASLEVSDVKPLILRAYTPPQFQLETEGYWKRTDPNSYGKDPEGNQIRGRTWVKAATSWRGVSFLPQTVFVKASISSAKLQIADYINSAQIDEEEKDATKRSGVVYVMRCLAMRDEIYKVGWTSKSAKQRAEQLSSATGVPNSFVVVETWSHPDPEALERGIHAMLNPYRLNEGREFFKLRYNDLKAIIEGEIERSSRH